MPKYLKYLNPSLLVFLVSIISLFSYIATPSSILLDFAKVEKHMSYFGILLYFIFILAFLIGSLNYKSVSYIPPREVILKNHKYRQIIIVTLVIFGFLTVGGYLLWFKDVITNFRQYLYDAIYNGILGSSEKLKEESSVKTLTNFGISIVTLSFLAYKFYGKIRYRNFAILILICSIFRVLFTAERVALLELIVPIIIIIIRFNPSLLRKMLMFGLITLVIIWSTELFRSYMSPVYYIKYKPLEFLFYRFSMYFSTSVNNFQILLYDTFPKEVLPISARTFYKYFNPNTETGKALNLLLNRYGSEEYNNFTAWGELFIDFGYFGIIVSLFLGIFSRVMYNRFISGNIVGLYMYPLLILFFLQSFRTLLLVNIRFYASYVVIIFFLILFNSFKSSKH